MNIRKVDHAALRTNQAFIIASLLIAFLLNVPEITVLVAGIMLLGTVFPKAALFKRIYQHVLRPIGLVQPDIREDNPEPHRFAQGFGALVTGFASALLLADIVLVGWALVWLVIGLAAINLSLGFCAGCFIYYQLSKRRLPGFSIQASQQ